MDGNRPLIYSLVRCWPEHPSFTHRISSKVLSDATLYIGVYHPETRGLEWLSQVARRTPWGIGDSLPWLIPQTQVGVTQSLEYDKLALGG
jgi:hypothetical protein